MIALTFAAVPPWQVAYTARIYYPAGDRRVSHYQVYLCDRNGQHRRQVTDGKLDCWGVRWLDRKTIAWSCNDGTLWRMRVDGGRPALWKRFKATRTDAPRLQSQLRNPGRPLFGVDRVYAYEKGKLVPVSVPENVWVGAAPGCAVRPTGSSMAPQLVGKEGPLNLEGAGEDAMLGPATAFSGPGKDDLWILDASELSSWGEYFNLIRYRRSTGKVKWKRLEFVDLDFRPSRPLYACVGVRHTKPLGKIQVWTAPICIGDWQSAKEWPILPALADGASVSLRP